MDIRSERILLTGKSGFTGRRLAQRLEARGLEVVGLECNGCPLDVRERRAPLRARGLSGRLRPRTCHTVGLRSRRAPAG